MRLKRIIIACCIFLFSSHTFNHASIGDEGWIFEKKENGIEVYIRDFNDSSLKEFKGIMEVRNASLSSFVAAFDDTKSYPRWMHQCIESRLLKLCNDFERYTYTVTHVPWPGTDRDTVVYSLLRQNPLNLSVTIAISGKPTYIPKNGNRVRIPLMNATWTFTPVKPGVVRVIYQVVTDPGGWLPTKFASIGMVDLPFYTMHKLRNIIKEERYATATYSVIIEPDDK